MASTTFLQKGRLYGLEPWLMQRYGRQAWQAVSDQSGTYSWMDHLKEAKRNFP